MAFPDRGTEIKAALLAQAKLTETIDFESGEIIEADIAKKKVKEIIESISIYKNFQYQDLELLFESNSIHLDGIQDDLSRRLRRHWKKED